MPASTNTPSRILSAALAELSEAGSGYLRIDQVAERAGVNKRMIYHHFSDRTGLLQASFALLVRLAEAGNRGGQSDSFLAACRQCFRHEVVQPLPDVALTQHQILRTLVAEFCRIERPVSEDLLTFLIPKSKEKPVYRMPSASRPANLD